MTASRVPAGEEVEPLVLALDVGSTASRGDVFDAAGRPAGRGRHKVPHQFETAGDGTSVIDPDQVLSEIEEILSELTDAHEPGTIAGVALDTFASSLVGVGADGRPVTPCFTYADSRCSAQVTALRQELDEQQVQQRTGCRQHSSYLPARLRWLAETQPETFAAARRWMSLGEYVYLRLLGRTAAGTATAAWTGMLDRRTGRWDPELLAAAGITEDQLSDVRNPDNPITEVDAGVGTRWPALAGARWFAPISDGFASNLGTGASDASVAALAAATSGAVRVLVDQVPEQIPAGLWCYRVDARRSLLGGAVNDVGRAVSWVQSTLQLPEDGLDPLAAAPPGPGTPLVLPYLTGERATGWAAHARAVISGVSASTTGAGLARGVLEGVAFSYARVVDQLRTVAGDLQEIRASGRVVAELPGMLQVLADVLGTPVVPVTIRRATLRGTALHALEVLAPDVPRSPLATSRAVQPVTGREAHYRGRAEEYQQVYAALVADR